MAKRHTAVDKKSKLDNSQADIFQPIAEHSDIAELCSALYERTLIQLSQEELDAGLLRRRLASLPFYVRHAAHGSLQAAQHSPLQLDAQNASWQAPQATACPAGTGTAQKQHAWFKQHAALGLVVPVRYETSEFKTIVLDSIDRVDSNHHRVHLNYQGWFSFSGEGESPHLTLLKPTKRIMTAACCGHQWNHRGRVNPRTLTLRELLLVATLDWRQFKVALKIAR